MISPLDGHEGWCGPLVGKKPRFRDLHIGLGQHLIPNSVSTEASHLRTITISTAAYHWVCCRTSVSPHNWLLCSVCEILMDHFPCTCTHIHLCTYTCGHTSGCILLGCPSRCASIWYQIELYLEANPSFLWGILSHIQDRKLIQQAVRRPGSACCAGISPTIVW